MCWRTWRMCVGVCVRLNVWVCVGVRVRMRVCVGVHVRMCVCVGVRVMVWVCVGVRVMICVPRGKMYVHACKRMYMGAYVWTHAKEWSRIYMVVYWGMIGSTYRWGWWCFSRRLWLSWDRFVASCYDVTNNIIMFMVSIEKIRPEY